MNWTTWGRNNRNKGNRGRGNTKAQNKRRKRRIKIVLVEAAGNRCVDCGWQAASYFQMMLFDFHHRDPATKSFAISKRLKSGSKAALLEEITKCDLLCCRCHRIRHINELEEREQTGTPGQIDLKLEKIYCAYKAA